MVSFKSLVATAVISAATLTSAQSSSPVRGFDDPKSTFASNWNIPASGDDVFLQIQGPTSAGWIGTGIGSSMRGSLMFTVYPNGEGNVTVSPRLGRGEVEPKFESTIKFELLEGSGVNGDLMTANIKCSNCRTWDGGSLSATSTSQNFIWALGDQSVTSKDQTETLRKHVTNGFYRIDMTQATGGNSQNPFLSVNSPSGTASGGPEATGGSNSGGSSSGSSSSGASSSGSTTGFAPPMTKADKVLIAHGVIMGVVFILLFPFGAALVRLLNNRIPNAFALHRGLQILNFMLAVVGMGMGIWRSEISDSHYVGFHQYFGTIIIALLLVQAMLGQLHHHVYLKTQKRSLWSYAHVWHGRFVIVAGIVNGGIGLALPRTDAPQGAVVAYSVVAGVVGVGYLVFYFLKERRREAGVSP
ncbi:hypothetical protein HOY80DRAFT_914390 [Tuber brumale]|nr:hypothetical protein HOY80DRAFT_914390 [Tuber brumale]